MKKLLTILVIAGLAVPAMAQVAYFGVTGDGSFDTYRSNSGPEGYSNGGGGASVRISKGNQGMGWLSFLGATADGSGQSLTSYLAAHPTATATLYVKTATAALPAGYTADLISLRAGNTGALVEDAGNGNGLSTTNLPAGFTGASELMAFRAASPAPIATFPRFGDGIYTLEDPNSTAGIQGQPWLTPSTRVANSGSTPFKWNPNQQVRYDTGVMVTSDGLTPATGKYIGYFPDPDAGNSGRSYYALEDVLGLNNNNSRNASLASITSAGQIINTSRLTPAAYAAAGGVSPRPGTVQDGNWMAISIDAAFLADMANNPENKGFVFATNVFDGSDGLGIAGATLSNADFWTANQNASVSPYLVVTPEPATMVLLALGGLALIRRRYA